MRFLYLVTAFVCLLSCIESDRNLDGSVKNYEPLPVDTAYYTPWYAFFDFEHVTYDTVCQAIKKKVTGVLGTEIFTDKDLAIMQDSIKRAMFSYDSVFIKGEIQIDTTNLLTLRDETAHYLGETLVARKIDGRNIVTQADFFTYQTSRDFDIGYTIIPRVKKVFSRVGRYKTRLRGHAIPPYTMGNTTAFIESMNVYDCQVNLSIEISIIDKSGVFDSKTQFIELLFKDRARMYTAIDWHESYKRAK